MIDESVLYHLNHRMMTALIGPDVIESKPHPAIHDYIQELREEGYNIYMGDHSYQYSEEDLHVIDRLVAWISQIVHAEHLIANEDEEMFDEFPDLHLDLIREAVTGLAVYYNQNPEGINFFISEGETIILVPSPYFLFEEILRNTTGINYTPLDFDSVIKGGSVF